MLFWIASTELHIAEYLLKPYSTLTGIYKQSCSNTAGFKLPAGCQFTCSSRQDAGACTIYVSAPVAAEKHPRVSMHACTLQFSSQACMPGVPAVSPPLTSCCNKQHAELQHLPVKCWHINMAGLDWPLEDMSLVRCDLFLYPQTIGVKQ